MESLDLPSLPTYLFDMNLAGILSLVVTVLLPVLSALFMKANWSSFVKGLILLVFAAVKTFLESWIVSADAGVAFDFYPALYTTAVNFLIAVGSYVGLLKGTQLQQSALKGGLVKSVDNTGPSL